MPKTIAGAKQKTLKQRQYEVRALLRRRHTVTVADVAETFVISKPHAYDLLQGLVKRKEVRIAYTAPTGSGGSMKNVYALTSSYLDHLERCSKRSHEVEPWSIHYVDWPPLQSRRKPWYKRVAEWLIGQEARA